MAGGVPVNGVYDLCFMLWDACTNGNQLGVLTNTATAVSQSQFAVQLDFGAAAFDGGARWMESKR